MLSSVRLHAAMVAAMLFAVCGTASAFLGFEPPDPTSDPASWPVAIREAKSRLADPKVGTDVAAKRRIYRDALDAYEKLGIVKRQPIDSYAVQLYILLGDLDESQGRRQEAENAYQSAYSHQGVELPGTLLFHMIRRLEALYAEDGNCVRASTVARSDMGLIDMYPELKDDRLPAMMTLAGCDAHFGLNQAAKAEFDAAWSYAEHVDRLEPALIAELADASSRFYRAAHLDAEAVAADLRATRLRDKVLGVVVAPAQSKPAPAAPVLAWPENSGPDFVEPKQGACDPVYPRVSRLAEEQGTVKVLMRIDQNGNLLNISLTQSSGFKNLDRATLAAMGACKFKPGTRGGQAVLESFEATYTWFLGE